MPALSKGQTAFTPTEAIPIPTPTIFVPPTATAEPIVAQTDIYNFRVIADNGNMLTISFDYAYDGGVGETATGDAIALKGDGGRGSFIGLVCSVFFITFEKGFGSATSMVSCSNLDEPQKSIETGTIKVAIRGPTVNGQGSTYFEKQFPYSKVWPPKS